MNKFYDDVEVYINARQSVKKSSNLYESLMLKFENFPNKTKNKLYHTLSDALEECESIKYTGEVTTLKRLLEAIKTKL